jgi:hypothetical protein
MACDRAGSKFIVVKASFRPQSVNPDAKVQVKRFNTLVEVA